MIAVLAVADRLDMTYWPAISVTVGTTTHTMHGATALAMMLKAKVISGMLADGIRD